MTAIRLLARACVVALALTGSAAAQDRLLNVSYDATREFYRDIGSAFTAFWLKQTNRRISIQTSHGGSGAQARAVLEGLPADVVTLALASDIDALAARGLLAPNWAERLPDHAVPNTSTIVFLVRSSNPKAIHDWPDLIRPGVAVITPNPKTSGGARWAYLAAYGWAMRQPGGSDATAEAYMRTLFAHVPVLDTGSRGATTTFAQRGTGDVLLSWESEAMLAEDELGQGKFEIVYPSLTIVAEPPVAVIDSDVDRKGTRAAAEAYLKFLWTPEAQATAVRHHLRPRDAELAAASFPAINSFTIADLGGWTAVQKAQFADGGVFDRITAR